MQVASLQEMSRVLCVGGRALIYVWAKDQKKKEMSSYLKQNKKNRDGGAEGKEHVDRERGFVERLSDSHESHMKRLSDTHREKIALLGKIILFII